MPALVAGGCNLQGLDEVRSYSVTSEDRIA